MTHQSRQARRTGTTLPAPGQPPQINVAYSCSSPLTVHCRSLHEHRCLLAHVVDCDTHHRHRSKQWAGGWRAYLAHSTVRCSPSTSAQSCSSK